MRHPNSRFCLPLTLGLAAGTVLAQPSSVILNYGSQPQVNDRTPGSGPGINNGPSAPYPGMWLNLASQATFPLQDYNVVLLNDATVAGINRPVDGIAIERVIQNTFPSGSPQIPPDTTYERTQILLLARDLNLFGPGATLSAWDRPFPLAEDSQLTYNSSRSFYVGGGPFGGLGGMEMLATGYDVAIRSFSIVPEPSPLAFGILGTTALLLACRHTRPRR